MKPDSAYFGRIHFDRVARLVGQAREADRVGDAAGRRRLETQFADELICQAADGRQEYALPSASPRQAFAADPFEENRRFLRESARRTTPERAEAIRAWMALR